MLFVFGEDKNIDHEHDAWGHDSTRKTSRYIRQLHEPRSSILAGDNFTMNVLSVVRRVSVVEAYDLFGKYERDLGNQGCKEERHDRQQEEHIELGLNFVGEDQEAFEGDHEIYVNHDHDQGRCESSKKVELVDFGRVVVVAMELQDYERVDELDGDVKKVHERMN